MLDRNNTFEATFEEFSKSRKKSSRKNAKKKDTQPKAPKVFYSKQPIPLKDWLKGKNSPRE